MKINGTFIDTTDMNLGTLQQMVKDKEDWCGAIDGVSESQTQLIDWTIAKIDTLQNLV